VVLVLLFFRPLLASFPTVALAAIVIHAALRLIDLDGFRNLQRFRASEFRLALATAAGVLLTDILVGVALAVALSVIDLFARIVRPNDAVLGEVPHLAGYHDVRDWQGARTRPGLVIYRYDAPLCFANADHFHRRALEAIAAENDPVEWFLLNAEAITEIDSTAADAIADLCSELNRRDIRLVLARVKQDLYVLLERAGLVDLIGSEQFHPTLSTAITAFERRFRGGGGPQVGLRTGA
jgi:MFS superfamily sulfate permease-like transporter